MNGGLVAGVDVGPKVIKSLIALAEASSFRGHFCDINNIMVWWSCCRLVISSGITRAENKSPDNGSNHDTSRN